MVKVPAARQVYLGVDQKREAYERSTWHIQVAMTMISENMCGLAE